MALSDFTPTPADVAAHMRARLSDKHDNEYEEFTATTRPTLAQITALCPTGARRVASHIGVSICEGGDTERQAELYTDAKDAAALAVAILAERSFFSEQLQSELSPYKAMREEWKEVKETLVEAVAEHCGGGDGESVGGTGPMPSSNFPPASGIGCEVW